MILVFPGDSNLHLQSFVKPDVFLHSRIIVLRQLENFFSFSEKTVRGRGYILSRKQATESTAKICTTHGLICMLKFVYLF